jgi:3-dehydroquinate synthase
MSKAVQVELGQRSYPINVGTGLLKDVATACQEATGGKQFFIVTDSCVKDHHLSTLEESFKKAGLEYHVIILPAGEQTKQFDSLQMLITEVLSHKVERSSVLVALGGGVIGDITGFAASIILRGIAFVQIPTTLLAQVDSSVGGKTAINHPLGKNLIGSFYQPRLVLADVGLLTSLPRRQVLAGYAEVVKYGLLGDADFFNWLEAKTPCFESNDLLIEAVERSCRAKAQIVAKDEREGGLRALLNLGHTFGHAYERLTGYSDLLLHGEGVAIGMVHAFALSAQLGLCSEDDVERVRAHLKQVGLPTSLKDIDYQWDIDAIVKAMGHDKKVKDKKLVFIVARSIGDAFIKEDVDTEAVYATLERDIKE